MRNRRKSVLWISGATLALIALVAVVVHWAWAPLDEVVELFGGDSKQQLSSDPAEASPNGTRVLLFALDGVGLHRDRRAGG